MNHKIVNTARSWLATPFKHQGRLKGIGCDCLGLVMGIAKELGLKTISGKLIAELDHADYHMISSGMELKQKLDDNLEQLQSLKIGALVLLEFDTDTYHLAIISDNQVMGFNLIHADLSKRMVVEHNLNDGYFAKIKGIYNLGAYNTSIPHAMFNQILMSRNNNKEGQWLQ